MAKNDFQYGGWNYYTLQCGTIMTLISPGDCTLQCGRWLWDDMPWNSPKRPPYWTSTSVVLIFLYFYLLVIGNYCVGLLALRRRSNNFLQNRDRPAPCLFAASPPTVPRWLTLQFLLDLLENDAVDATGSVET